MGSGSASGEAESGVEVEGEFLPGAAQRIGLPGRSGGGRRQFSGCGLPWVVVRSVVAGGLGS